eukprot:3040261-Pyramimonas_sp.AAC.1
MLVGGCAMRTCWRRSPHATTRSEGCNSWLLTRASCNNATTRSQLRLLGQDSAPSVRAGSPR